MSDPLDKRLLQAVLQSAGVGLMVQDKTRRIILLNPVFEEITGWRWKEIGGKECSLVFGCRTSTGKCLGDSLCPGLKVVEEENQIVSRELLINRGDGGEKWVEVTVSSIKGEGGGVEYIVSTFKDISEKKRYSEELLQAKTLATLGQLAAELAHEVKNPLNSIQIQVHLMEKELDKLPDTSARVLTELISRTKEETRRLNTLVNQCLHFSRSTQLYLQQEELGPMLEDLIGLIRPQASLAGINVELEIEEALPRIMLDREKFRQALLNLLLNALEAMPDGGSLHVKAWLDSNSVRFSIKDTGKGIPDEIKEKVFELFYTTKKGGTGIGLPLAYNIIQAHGGTISFNSSVKGTEFVITLPCAGGVRNAECGVRS
jgi:PAS domain S-box-containing protein